MAEIAHLEQDISEIKKDLSSLRGDVSTLKTDMAVLKTEANNYATKAELEKMGRTIIMWLSGMIIASTSLILASLRFSR